ncbi:MAG: hypothetical protein JO210_07785 [Acidobacteriaceae bacterium]|nr:hypothetical protein [Acidobacteriaceae bacterium]
MALAPMSSYQEMNPKFQTLIILAAGVVPRTRRSCLPGQDIIGNLIFDSAA